MPTYQYACTACEEQLEVVQKFTDDPLTVCAECGGKLRKLYSAVGIVFKGSGFYRTDSRSGSGANGSSSNGSSGNGSGANGSSSPDSKKTESAPSGSAGSAGSSGGDSKPAPKAEKTGSSSPATGTKVA